MPDSNLNMFLTKGRQFSLTSHRGAFDPAAAAKVLANRSRLARNRGSVDAVVYVMDHPDVDTSDALSVPADAPEGCNAR